jgi:UDPglucose 6-dehydrogenase
MKQKKATKSDSAISGCLCTVARSNFKNQRLSSELSKLTANAFFGTTSFFHKRNERIQKWKTGANVAEVARAIGMEVVWDQNFKASVGFEDRVFVAYFKSCLYFKIICLNEVDYWEQVIIMNDHQKRRFARNIVCTLYNTVADKKIAFLGWAFKRHQRWENLPPFMLLMI